MSTLPNEQELSFLACLLGVSDTTTAATPEYSASEPVKLTLEQLDYHGISALIDPTRLSNPALANELNQRRALLAANEAIKTRELTQLFKAFNSAGLNNFVVFKGTALAHTCYQQSWHRPRSDTDIFIDRAHLGLFREQFDRLGYEELLTSAGNYISYQSTFGKRLAGSATLNIDVHWRISNRQCLANTFTINELQESATALKAFDDTACMPSLVNCLLIACLHRLGHHNNEERLAWLYDIHLLSNRLSSSEWREFIQAAQNKKLNAVCLDGLKNSIRYLDSAVPSYVLDELVKPTRSNEPSALLIQRGLPRWKLMVSDLRSIHGLTGKLSFLREMAFPSADYVRQKMQTNSVIKAYVLRAWKGVAKLAKPKR